MTAATHGACIANYVEAAELLTDQETGMAAGVEAVDTITGKKLKIRAKATIFCGKHSPPTAL